MLLAVAARERDGGFVLSTGKNLGVGVAVGANTGEGGRSEGGACAFKADGGAVFGAAAAAAATKRITAIADDDDDEFSGEGDGIGRGCFGGATDAGGTVTLGAIA